MTEIIEDERKDKTGGEGDGEDAIGKEKYEAFAIGKMVLVLDGESAFDGTCLVVVVGVLQENGPGEQRNRNEKGEKQLCNIEEGWKQEKLCKEHRE